jgi:hypothetical protein
MSDAVHSSSVSEDIAFIRAMAEEGRNRPWRGGVSLIAGLIWGSASLYSWSVVAKLWTSPFGPDSAGWVWLVASVVFAIVGFPIGMFSARPDTNRVAAATWGSVGIASWTISAAIVLAAVRTHQPVIFALLPPVMMAIYGGAWFMSAAAYKTRWQLWVGGLSVLSSLVLAYVAAQPVELLLFALALYGLAGVPGLIAVVRAPKA